VASVAAIPDAGHGKPNSDGQERRDEDQIRDPVACVGKRRHHLYIASSTLNLTGQS
jgi:hypothetical protein